MKKEENILLHSHDKSIDLSKRFTEAAKFGSRTETSLTSSPRL